MHAAHMLFLVLLLLKDCQVVFSKRFSTDILEWKSTPTYLPMLFHPMTQTCGSVVPGDDVRATLLDSGLRIPNMLCPVIQVRLRVGALITTRSGMHLERRYAKKKKRDSKWRRKRNITEKQGKHWRRKGKHWRKVKEFEAFMKKFGSSPAPPPHFSLFCI